LIRASPVLDDPRSELVLHGSRPLESLRRPLTPHTTHRSATSRVRGFIQRICDSIEPLYSGRLGGEKRITTSRSSRNAASASERNAMWPTDELLAHLHCVAPGALGSLRLVLLLLGSSGEDQLPPPDQASQQELTSPATVRRTCSTRGGHAAGVAVSFDRPYGLYPQIFRNPQSVGSGEFLLWEDVGDALIEPSAEPGRLRALLAAGSRAAES
jgi:hypothetical protein